MRHSFILSAICMAALATVSAQATTIFTLNQDACSGTCGTAPFGTVALTDNGNGTVTVVETLAANERFAKTGAGDALEFNVSGPITITGLTAGFTAGGADTASAFGSFLDSIICSACGNGGNPSNPSGPVTFTVGSASGVTIASFIGSSKGYYFSADIVGNNGNTGNVGSLAGTTTGTPEPTSVALTLVGLALTVGGSLRKRF